MRPCFHRNPQRLHIDESLRHSGFGRPEASFFGHLAGLVQHSVMTPLVTQIDANGRRSNQHLPG
jgi:hypothetical protein